MFTSRHAQLKLTTFDVRPPSAAGGYFALFYDWPRTLMYVSSIRQLMPTGRKRLRNSAANTGKILIDQR